MCPQLQERKELGQVDETLSFAPLIEGQLLTTVLAIEQTVQAFVYTPRKLEALQ